MLAVWGLTYSDESDCLEGDIEREDEDEHDENGIQVELPHNIATPVGGGRGRGGRGRRWARG